LADYFIRQLVKLNYQLLFYLVLRSYSVINLIRFTPYLYIDVSIKLLLQMADLVRPIFVPKIQHYPHLLLIINHLHNTLEPYLYKVILINRILVFKTTQFKPDQIVFVLSLQIDIFNIHKQLWVIFNDIIFICFLLLLVLIVLLCLLVWKYQVLI